MNRNEILKDVLALKDNNICLELATGTGKTRLAIEILKHRKCKKVLIAIPRLVLIDNWKRELGKWRYIYSPIFTTYVSLHKHIGEYDAVIYDECFRGDTEILTPNGYKRFDTLTENDEVAQWLDNGQIQFVKPIRFIKRIHSGDICKVHLKRDRYVYMTPNHNQVYRTKQIKEWRVKPIKDLSFHSNVEIPTSGKGTGNNSSLTNLERLLIAIQADGTLQRHQINESVYSIQLTKERKINRLFQITEGLNISEVQAREGARRWLCKIPKGDAKLLSTFFDIDMGYNRANQFIEEIVEWDGSHLVGNNLYYSSKVKENADFVAAVAIQAGYEVFQSVEHDSRKDTYSIIHRVFMKKRLFRSTQCMKKEYIPYNDYVYCVEVPSHKIVVRSEGVTFISGNCHHITDRCYEAIEHIYSRNNIFLSATLKNDMKFKMREAFGSITYYRINTRQAIDEEILPEPKILLLPLCLDTKNADYNLVIHSSGKTTKEILYRDRWKYMKDKSLKLICKCTQWQYIDYLNKNIDFYKRRYMISRNEVIKNKWLHLCGDRLKFLAECKMMLSLSSLISIRMGGQ